MDHEANMSKEILRPPQYTILSPVSSTPSPPLSPQPACFNHFVNEEGEDPLKKRVLEQEEEIRGLKSEVKNLKRCIKGVHIIGRELQKSKEENRRLKTIPLDGTNEHEKTECLGDENGDIADTDEEVEVVDEENNGSSSEGGSDEEEEEESSSSEGSSDEEEEDDEEDEDEDEEENSEEGTDEDDDEVDEFDGLEDHVESDEQEVKPTTSVKRKSKTRIKVKPRKLQQLKAENARLLAETKELKAAREAETANAFHYVTTTEANELQRNTQSDAIKEEKSSVGLDTEGLGWEKRYRDLEIENGELKATVKEIKKVNHKWDQFWNDKKSEHESKMKEKNEEIARLSEMLAEKDEEVRLLQDRQEKEWKEHSATIRKMERVLDVEASEKEKVAKEKDEMLLMAKQRVDKAESTNEQLRREMTKEQQKCERAQKLARNLLKQKKEMEDEIKRLNGTLTEKCEETSLLKSIEPKMTSGDMQLSVTEVSQGRPSSPLSPSHLNVRVKELLGELTEDRVRDGRQRKPAVVQQQVPSAEERSLTKDELKEKVELFREQTEAYESDFRRERRDREAVVGQLDSVKKELREAKAILNNGPKPQVHVHRIKDKPIHKDPKRRQLPAYMQATASPRQAYPNKRDNLIAHGHGGSRPKPERPQPKQHREHEHHYHQPRYFEDYREYEPEVFEDDDEQYQICRCPRHDCYVPVVQPMNNLSKTNGAC